MDIKPNLPTPNNSSIDPRLLTNPQLTGPQVGPNNNVFNTPNLTISTTTGNGNTHSTTNASELPPNFPTIAQEVTNSILQVQAAITNIRTAIETRPVADLPRFANSFQDLMAKLQTMMTQMAQQQKTSNFESMRSERQAIVSAYKAQFDQMVQAADDNFSAALTEGITNICMAGVSWAPLIGDALQNLGQGVSSILSGYFKHEAEMAQAQQTLIQGQLTQLQSNYDMFKEYFDQAQSKFESINNDVQQMLQSYNETQGRVNI